VLCTSYRVDVCFCVVPVPGFSVDSGYIVSNGRVIVNIGLEEELVLADDEVLFYHLSEGTPESH
jgi:hypothetical protein